MRTSPFGLYCTAQWLKVLFHLLSFGNLDFKGAAATSGAFYEYTIAICPVIHDAELASTYRTTYPFTLESWDSLLKNFHLSKPPLSQKGPPREPFSQL